MKRTALDDVLSPVMPDLDDDGTELYSEMIATERHYISDLIQSNDVKIFFLESHDTAPIEIISEEDFPEDSKRGRNLVIIKPGFDYKLLLNNLASSREVFLDYLQKKVDEQNLLTYKNKKPQSGIRTTALPTIIDFNVQNITYSYNAAYKASSVTKKEIAELFSIKEEKLKKSLENSKNRHQHKRSEDYTERLKNLKAQEKIFKKISSNIVARVSSGHGLSLRATNTTDPAVNFKIKNISLIFSDEPDKITLKKANQHDRPSVYGSCILEIDELNLKIYEKP